MGRAILLQLAASLALSIANTAPAMADVESPRFQVHGEIQPQSRSDDGRFVIKAINVPEAGCDPLLDLFANGFEGL